VKCLRGVTLALAGTQRLLGQVKRGQQLNACALSFLPLRKSLPHGLIGIAEAAFLDS